MGTNWSLRRLDTEPDRAAVAELWQAALGPLWTITPRALDVFGSGFVAETGAGQLIGAVAVDPAGSVPAVLVAPDHQRHGIGTALLAAAEDHLRSLGATEVRAGGGGRAYIWPGVPDDLPAAVAFFAARGWRPDATTIDLIRDLADYRPPPDVYDRVTRAGVVIGTDVEDRTEVVAFEAATFRSWLPAFEGWAPGAAPAEPTALVARDPAGRIVGTLLFSGPDADLTLRPMLGPRCGDIGCVGVAPDAEGLGIGSAMVARASELLRDRGTRTCHIGWVVRETFYTRVGYRPWRRYLMYRRRLDA